MIQVGGQRNRALPGSTVKDYEQIAKAIPFAR
jgi:hypothetical protein